MTSVNANEPTSRVFELYAGQDPDPPYVLSLGLKSTHWWRADLEPTATGRPCDNPEAPGTYKVRFCTDDVVCWILDHDNCFARICDVIDGEVRFFGPTIDMMRTWIKAKYGLSVRPW